MYVSFINEEVFVRDGEDNVAVCVQLSGLLEPLGSGLWVNVKSEDHSAIG